MDGKLQFVGCYRESAWYSDGAAGSEWREGRGSERRRARGRRVTSLEREKRGERDSKKEIDGDERDRGKEEMHRGREKWE